MAYWGTISTTRHYGEAESVNHFYGLAQADVLLYGDIKPEHYYSAGPVSGDHFYGIAKLPTYGASFLVPSTCRSVHVVGEPNIYLGGNFLADNTFHTVGSTTPAISFTITIRPASSSHVHTADSPTISFDPGEGTVSPARSSHVHTADSPTITFDSGEGTVSPAMSSHVHTTDSPIITYTPSTPATSPEVQAVWDRMAALSQGEKDAIEVFVDGLVADGIWGSLDEFWCFALNGTDWLTGWKANNASIFSGDVTRSADGAATTNGVLQTGIDLGLQTNYQLGDAEAGVYVHSTSAWGTSNYDFFGVEDASTRRTRVRHRGSDTNDTRNSINQNQTHDTDLDQATELDGILISLRDDGIETFTLFNGVKQTEQVDAGGVSVPTGYDVRIFAANNQGANSQGAKPATFTSFYVGSEIDTVQFLARLNTLHTGLGVS